MVQLYKTASEASQEVRSAGQTGITPDANPDPIQSLSQAQPDTRPTRSAIAPPPQATVDVMATQPESDPLQAVMDLRQSLMSNPETAMPTGDIGTQEQVAGKELDLIEQYMSANRARNQQESNEAPKEEPGLLSDAGNLLGLGVNSLALNVRELVGRIPGAGKKIVESLDAVDQWASGQSSEDLLKQNLKLGRADLSQATREAGDKDWWDSEKNTFGPAWSDPRSYMSGVLQSLPESAVTMFPAMGLARAVYTAKLAMGATKAVAGAAAARSAALAGGVSEGLLAGASSSREVRDNIMALTPKQLEESDAYRTLVLNGMQPDAAKTLIANDQATQAFITSGVVTGAFGGFGDRLLAKAITQGVGKSFVGRVSKGALTEGVLEEFPQEFGSAVSENFAMQPAVPSTELTDNALNRALGGLATGAVQGGAMTAAFGRNAPADETTTPAPAVATEDTSLTGIQEIGEQEAAPSPIKPFVMPQDLFMRTVQSPEGLQALAGMYAVQGDMERQRISDFVAINNLDVDLDKSATVPSVQERGRSLIAYDMNFVKDLEYGMDEFFATNQEAADTPPVDVTPSAIAERDREILNSPSFDVEELSRQASIADDPQEAAVEAALGSVSLAERKEFNDKRQKAIEEQDSLGKPNPLSEYIRRAQNLEAQPTATQSIVAASAISEMQERGFSDEEAQGLFGRFIPADAIDTAPAVKPEKDVAPKQGTLKFSRTAPPVDTSTPGIDTTFDRTPKSVDRMSATPVKPLSTTPVKPDGLNKNQDTVWEQAITVASQNADPKLARPATARNVFAVDMADQMTSAGFNEDAIQSVFGKDLQKEAVRKAPKQKVEATVVESEEQDQPEVRRGEPGIEQDSALARSKNPNIQSGKDQPKFVAPTDIGTPTSAKDRIARAKKNRVELNKQEYSEPVARAVIALANTESVNVSRVSEISTDAGVVGTVFTDGNSFYRFTIRPNKSWEFSRFPTEAEATIKKPANAVVTAVNEDAPRQNQLSLDGEKQLTNKFKAKIQQLMIQSFTPSRVENTLEELRSSLDKLLDRRNRFFKSSKGKTRSDAEYIFEQFAQSGAIEKESNGELAEDIAAIREVIDTVQSRSTASRAGLLKVHAAKISDALDDVRNEMIEAGLTAQQADDLIGPPQRSINQVLNEPAPAKTIEVGQSIADQPEQLNLASRDFSDARIAAAAAVDEIVETKVSPMTVVRRELSKSDREFSFSDLRSEMAARGMDVTEIDREVLQWPAAQYSLERWVIKNRDVMSPYAARTSWFNSFEQVMAVYRDAPKQRAEFENELSDVERLFVERMRASRRKLKNRMDEQTVDGDFFPDPERAFPDALFNQYSLNDMVQFEEANIAEDEKNMLISLVSGQEQLLPRLWLDDVSYALSARSDLAPQIMAKLTEQEQGAVMRYVADTSSIVAKNERIAALRTYSTTLDNIQGLDPAGYEAFKQVIANSELSAIPKLLQAAQEIAALSESTKNAQELGTVLSAYLDRIYVIDESASVTLDEAAELFSGVKARTTLSVTEQEVDDFVESNARLGDVYGQDRDAARNALLFQRAAEATLQREADAVGLEQQGDDRFVVADAAAREDSDPANTVGLTGDIAYKRGRNSNAAVAIDVQGHIASIINKWKNKPNVQVFYNVGQIQDPELKRQLSARVDGGSFKGAIDTETGAVYIFSQHIESLEDAEFVLFHELYGHYGLRRFLGDKLNPFLENQYKFNKAVKAEANRQFNEALNSGAPMSRIESIEEAISDMGAKDNTNLFRQLMGQLVNWLRKNNMPTVADWIDSSGVSELAFVLSAARKAARNGSTPPLTGAPSGVLYSRNQGPAEIYAMRGDNLTGYARLNPALNVWTVFTITDVATGDYGAVTVEKLEDVTRILSKVGTLRKSKSRANMAAASPGTLQQIPVEIDLSDTKNLMRNAQIQLQNQYLPIFEVAQKMSDMGVENTVIDDLVKYDARLGERVKHFERSFVKPLYKLLKTISKKGGTLDDVERYILAKHAPERNAAIQSINPSNTQGSGMATGVAKNLISSMDSGRWSEYSTELEQIRSIFDAMSVDKTNYMLSSGLINQMAFKGVSQYKHYVNLSGNLNEAEKAMLGARAFSSSGSGMSRATGRGTEAVDVLQNTLNSYLTTIIRGEQNKVKTSIYDMLNRHSDPSFVRINPINERKQINFDKLSLDKKILNLLGDQQTKQSGEQYLNDLRSKVQTNELTADQAVSELRQRVNQLERMREIEPSEANAIIRRIDATVIESARLSPDGYVSMAEDSGAWRDPNNMVARIDGNPMIMEFQTRGQEVVQSLTGMQIQPAGGFVNAIGGWNRFFSQMVTTWNPAWLPINFVRDAQSAFSNAAADPEVGVELAKKMAKEFMPALSAAFKYTVSEQATDKDGLWGAYLKARAKKNPLDPKYRALIDEFYASGAAVFFLDRKGTEATFEKLNRKMNGAKGALEHTQDWLEGVGYFMDFIATPSELAPRLAIYKVLRENGKSIEFASRYAKEVTVNFNMKGASKEFRSLYVFANPAIQGTFRQFKDYSRGSEGASKYLPSNRFAAVAGSWIMLGMVTNLIARAIGGDDEERPGVDKLSTIPDFKRNTSLIIAPGILGGSLPVAYGWNVFSAAGTYMMDVMNGKMKPEVAASKILGSAFDSFAPIGSGATSESLGGFILKAALPSPVVPVLEIAMNENRFGAPIFKSASPFSNVQESDAYLHFNNVNPISKAAMQGIARLTSDGNPKYTPGLIDVNPAVIDYMISSYLPGLFNEAYKFAGWSANLAAGRDVKDLPVPIFGRFEAKTPEGFDTGASRRLAQAVDTKYKELTDYGNTTEARRAQILKQHPMIGNVKAMIGATDSKLRAININLKAIENNSRISEAEKVKTRNNMEVLKKKYRAQLVDAAVKSGFRDEIVDNNAPGILGKVANRLRD